ncbi:hypothetical protein RF11_15043 [Thelohanellus kitauei]|uniref:Uncharacterized protein n=1 Tax=Thelohanellus kitauei TaxID=669202 RepID=A0A0C2IES7_THEKT|nr:hypothetical protein RF11_15043 [Thelohanellus kitauei]
MVEDTEEDGGIPHYSYYKSTQYTARLGVVIAIWVGVLLVSALIILVSFLILYRNIKKRSRVPSIPEQVYQIGREGCIQQYNLIQPTLTTPPYSEKYSRDLSDDIMPPPDHSEVCSCSHDVKCPPYEP